MHFVRCCYLLRSFWFIHLSTQIKSEKIKFIYLNITDLPCSGLRNEWSIYNHGEVGKDCLHLYQSKSANEVVRAQPGKRNRVMIKRKEQVQRSPNRSKKLFVYRLFGRYNQPKSWEWSGMFNWIIKGTTVIAPNGSAMCCGGIYSAGRCDRRRREAWTAVRFHRCNMLPKVVKATEKTITTIAHSWGWLLCVY